MRSTSARKRSWRRTEARAVGARATGGLRSLEEGGVGMAVEIPAEVYEGLERVRWEGRTNMLDREAVQFLANENEDYATVVWIEDNKDLYAQGIFAGFEPAGESVRKES